MSRAVRSVPLELERTKRLRETWSYARSRSAYYARLLPDIDEEEISLARLSEIPICTKEELRSHGLEMRCSNGIPDFIAFTGGSSGRPNMICGDHADLGDPRDLPITLTRRGTRRLVVSSAESYHGHLPWVPGHWGNIVVPLNYKEGYSWLWELLTCEHAFEGFDSRVTHLEAFIGYLKQLVHYLLEQAADTSKLALESVGTYGWYLSSSWKRLIERTLGAAVRDRYGFTEIRAVANECAGGCGYYHYGERVIWEVVSPWEFTPIEEGIGRILVTSLYPFARDQILFRYEPGDVVALGPHCEYTGDRGFLPLGRMNNALWIETNGVKRWCVFPTQIQECLDSDYRVARLETTPAPGATANQDYWFPKWSVALLSEGETNVVEVQVEMKACPRLFQDAWSAFEEETTIKLLATSPELESLVESGEVSLRFRGLAPNGMANSAVVIC